MSAVVRLTDETFAAHTSGAPVLVVFSAPKFCPKCPIQAPIAEAVAALYGIPVYHVDVEQPDSQRLAKSRPLYLGTPKLKDGTRGAPQMMPDFRVPCHYVYASGRVVHRLAGLREAEDLVGLFEHGERVATLGMLGSLMGL